jgi:hypothetical protein
MPCKNCHKSWKFHADPNKYVRSWCGPDAGTIRVYTPMSNLEYLEYQYEKTQAV